MPSSGQIICLQFRLSSWEETNSRKRANKRGFITLLPQSSFMPTLQVTLLHGHHLCAKDLIGTSDPFVVLKVGHHSHKSSIRYKTLHPIWNETFTFHGIHGNEELSIHVYDYNILLANEPMGHAKLHLHNLTRGVPEKHTLHLHGHGHGTISIETVAVDFGRSPLPHSYSAPPSQFYAQPNVPAYNVPPPYAQPSVPAYGAPPSQQLYPQQTYAPPPPPPTQAYASVPSYPVLPPTPTQHVVHHVPVYHGHHHHHHGHHHHHHKHHKHHHKHHLFGKKTRKFLRKGFF
jgi:hypothetical protein